MTRDFLHGMILGILLGSIIAGVAQILVTLALTRGVTM